MTGNREAFFDASEPKSKSMKRLGKARTSDEYGDEEGLTRKTPGRSKPRDTLEVNDEAWTPSSVRCNRTRAERREESVDESDRRT